MKRTAAVVEEMIIMILIKIIIIITDEKRSGLMNKLIKSTRTSEPTTMYDDATLVV